MGVPTASATSSATAPRLPAATAANTIQRECTLCGRVVTNCAANTGFLLGEAVTGGASAYAFYLGITSLGFVSLAALAAIGSTHFAWARYRNVRALGDAANDVGDAADATHAAGMRVEQAGIQGAEAARRASVAAGRVLSAAEQLATATSTGHAADIAARAAEVKASAADVVDTVGGLPSHLNEFRHLLGTTSLLSHEMRRALAEIKKAIRSSSGDITQIADLETKFETASARLSGGLTDGVEELKQILMIMSQTSNLSMQIMRENNASLLASLEAKNVELAGAVDRAGAATSRMAESERDREALVARLEQVGRDNEALQTRLSDTVARLEAETKRWAEAAPRAAATVTAATTALGGERVHWEAAVETLRACVSEIGRMRRASGTILATISRSHSGGGEERVATTGEAKTGE